MAGKSKRIWSNLKAAMKIPAIPDEDTPEFTKAMFDRATFSIGDVVIRGPRKPGRRLGTGKKEGIQIRFDKDVLAYYRSTGRGWQTRMNEALRATLPKRRLAARPLRKQRAADRAG
jgi:uncharacterized protein (DUF4415 family)